MKGRFDFYISPTDENYLFVWDGKGDPLVDVRRVQPTEISDSYDIGLAMGRPWVAECAINAKTENAK